MKKIFIIIGQSIAVCYFAIVLFYAERRMFDIWFTF
jgi:hypothetical protein